MESDSCVPRESCFFLEAEQPRVIHKYYDIQQRRSTWVRSGSSDLCHPDRVCHPCDCSHHAVKTSSRSPRLELRLPPTKALPPLADSGCVCLGLAARCIESRSTKSTIITESAAASRRPVHSMRMQRKQRKVLTCVGVATPFPDGPKRTLRWSVRSSVRRACRRLQ